MKQLKELLIILEKQKKANSPSRAGSKALNDVLRSKRSGGHYSDKSDFKRSKEKEKARRELNEAEEAERVYFRYTLWYERKDHGNGDGGDRTVSGQAAGKDKAEVENRLKRSYPRTYRVDLKEISKEEFDKRAKSDD